MQDRQLPPCAVARRTSTSKFDATSVPPLCSVAHTDDVVSFRIVVIALDAACGGGEIVRANRLENSIPQIQWARSHRADTTTPME